MGDVGMVRGVVVADSMGFRESAAEVALCCAAEAFRYATDATGDILQRVGLCA